MKDQFSVVGADAIKWVAYRGALNSREIPEYAKSKYVACHGRVVAMVDGGALVELRSPNIDEGMGHVIYVAWAEFGGSSSVGGWMLCRDAEKWREYHPEFEFYPEKAARFEAVETFGRAR